MLLFSDLQNEVKRRSTKNQAGTQFDEAAKSAINSSLFRISREAPWRVMRRKAYFTTDAQYTTGTGAASITNGQKTLTVTGATFITDNIKVGRRMQIGASQLVYTIRTITGETTLTVDKAFDGTTGSTLSYKIYGTEEYNLPIQASHRLFLWHDQFGYPMPMTYITDQDFFKSRVALSYNYIPTHFRMWGEDMVLRQPNSASVMRISSSSTSDTTKNITIFGTVSGYPDYEIITTNASDGTTAVSGTKSFTSIERVVKDASTLGRITVDCNSAAVTIAVLPVGDTTGGILYRKVQLYPLPQTAFDINCWYYKDPYRLVNSGDIHELGQEFDECIILLAVSKVTMEQNKEEGDKFYSLFKEELKTLRRENMDDISWIPSLHKPKESYQQDLFINPNISYSQLGGNFGPMKRY